MQKLQQLSSHLKTKTEQNTEVYTIPLESSQEILQQIFSSELKCIMLFTSAPNKDGKQWCPYCVNAKPYYNQIYDEVQKLGLPMYVFIVGDQPTWKDQTHPFRKMKQLQIPSVPSFGYFNGKKLLNRLGGEEMIKHEMRKLVYEASEN